MAGANAEFFPFFPPIDLHNAGATDTQNSLLNHAQFRHNLLQCHSHEYQWFKSIYIMGEILF